jgi:hypothetical protein
MISRRSSRDNKRITRANEGITYKQFRAKRLAKQPVATLVVVQPGGQYLNVTVSGRDIEKIKSRNEAIYKAMHGDDGKLRMFNRRFKSFSVKDINTNMHVELIMSPETLNRSKKQMTKKTRTILDERYSEDMSEAA